MTQDSIRSTYVEMTPELAQKYLDTQILNRPLNSDWVAALVRVIKNGEWVADGNSIKMDNNGHLIDGQHRLAAIVRSGETLTMEVKSGFPYDALFVIDSFTRPRSTADILTLGGVKNTKCLASGIRAYYIEKSNWVSNNAYSKISPQHALAIYNSTPDLWVKCQSIADSARKALPLVAPALVCGWSAFLILEKGHSFDRVHHFFTQLCSAKEAQNVSIEKLRRILVRNRLSTKSYSAEVVRAYVVKTWNSYITGVRAKRLLVQKGETRVHFV